MKKNVPKIRFKGCQGEWERKKLGEVCATLRKKTLITSKLLEDGKYMVINSGREIYGYYDDYNNEGNAFTIAARGEYAGFVNYFSDKFYAGGLCYPYRTNDESQCLCRFAYYWLKSKETNIMETMVFRGSIPALNKSDLERFPIPLPTLPEQHQIASYFRSLDGIMSGCEARLSSLRRLKEGALQAFFPQQGETQPKIRFKGCKGEWERLPLSSIVTRVSDTGSSQSLPYVEFEDIVSGEGILNKDIKDKKGIKTGNKFVAGDVLFGKLRPYLKNILLANFTGVAVGDFWVLRPNGILPEILYLLVSSNAFMEVANISSGSKMPRSDWNLVSNSQFNIPPTLNEQRQIANFFRTLDSRIELERQRLEKLKQLKAACLEKMFV